LSGRGGDAAPLTLHRDVVRPEWIDYNGHMNVAYYVLAFDRATDAVLDRVGAGKGYAEAEGRSFFVVEMHVNYLREVGSGAPLSFETTVLGSDAKRVHLFHAMRHGTEGWVAATNELMLVHVDMAARRSVPMPAPLAAEVESLASAHAGLPRPEQAGRAVGLPRPRAGEA
jgi:acyl-CoA thioester hydrolase